MIFKRIKFPLAFAISSSFTLVLLFTGGLIGWFNYSGMKSILLASTSEVIKRSGQNTISELLKIYEPVDGFVRILATHPIIDSNKTAERMNYVPFLRAGLDTEEAMSSVYIGYEDGSFFLLRTIGSNYKPNFSIPEGAKYLLQTVEVNPGSSNIVLFFFYDSQLKELGSITPENYDYDPRTRDWYKNASEASSLIRTDPYIFFTTGEVGKTFALSTSQKTAVVGADVTLKALSNSLNAQKLTPSTQIALIDSKKNAIAYLNPDRLVLKGDEGKVTLARLDQLGVSVLGKIAERMEGTGIDSNFTLESGESNYFGFTSPIPVRGEEPHYLVIASPENELLEEARTGLNNTILITLGLLLFTLPIIFFVSKAISLSMNNLTDYTKAIRDFDFSGELVGNSRITELKELTTTVGIMKSTIQKFLDISSLLTGEKDFFKLMYHILSETASALNSKAGVLYILSNDEKNMYVGAIYLKDGSAISIQGTPNISMEKESSTFPILKNIKEEKTSVVHISSVAFSNELKFFGREREDDFPYLIGVPLKNQDRKVIGYLCLFEDHDVSEQTSLLSFVENLSGTSSVAIENQRVLESYKILLYSLAQTLSTALDSRSPHGGHCRKVPELALMLADAASEQEGGAFEDFNFGEEERESFKLAAYLHDIGKILVPEYVVEKSTKLETVYDRLNEVRLRFEIIKRDLRISFYKKLMGGGQKELLEKDLEKEILILDNEFTFIANCNEGEIQMTPENIERVKKIGMRTYERTLDDTIGLSYEEKLKKSKRKKPNPNIENLLSDRPEHLWENEDSDKISAENPWGFNIRVPRYKIHRGEIHNLIVEKGVHTEEEKFMINSHIIHTIKLLGNLSFPTNFKNIVEIAGGHHETLDGNGFPKKLKKEDLSIQARIMGLADLFESITAVEKPNKKGKTLSESIGIMDKMKKERRIDPDLFEIFLTSGVYLEYAKKHLQPYQIDEVDISKYVPLGVSRIESAIQAP